MKFRVIEENRVINKNRVIGRSGDRVI